MNIAYVISGLGIGGAEKQILALARVLIARGHCVTIVSMTGVSRHQIDDCDRVTLIELNEPKNLVGISRVAFKLAAILREGQFDVVHTHMFHANILVRLIRCFCRCNVLVSSVHSNIEGGWLRTAMYRLTDRLTDFTTNVSISAVNRYIKIKAASKDKIGVVYNGIDTSVFRKNIDARQTLRNSLGVEPDRLLILAVGRLTKAKDYPTLIDAFSLVCRSNSKAMLLIAGEGTLLSDLERLVRLHGVSDRVAFLGVRHDIPELMNASDIFVLSSQWEGFGLVVAEAMATELPVVATSTGGIPEVVGHAGNLVPPQNSALLAREILALATLPRSQRDDIGRISRQRVEQHFSLDAAVDNWLALYARLSRTANLLDT